jgi:hypothetical protein
MNSVTERPPEHHREDSAVAAVLARLERRMDRLERLLDEGIDAYLNARFPYGDGLAGDRWSRRRRR